MKNDTAGKQDGHNIVASQCRNEHVEGGDILPSTNDGGTSNAELDSLSTGEVKISLSCSSVLCDHIFVCLAMNHDQILKDNG